MSESIPLNNEKYGYKKFDFLYLDDSSNLTQQILQIEHALKTFFKDKQ